VTGMADKGKPGEVEDLDLPLIGDDETVIIEGDDARGPLDGDLEEPIAPVEADEPEEDAYAALEAQFKSLEAERNRVVAERDNERRRVSELEQTQNAAQLNEMQNHKLIIEHAIAATNTELEEAKRAYREARQLGDVDAELAATEALSDAKDKQRQLVAGHEEVVRRIQNPPAVQQQKQAAPAGDEIERMITENFPHPKDQAWLRAHRDDIFGNEKRRDLAVAVERTARLKDLAPNSDEYYAYLDREMGYNAVTEEPPQRTAPAKAKPVTEPPAPQGRKAPLPGAPVSRSNGGSGGDVERASPALKQLAKDLGMTVSEYLANDKLIREGKTHHRYS